MKNYGEFLADQMMKEFERQSGILGMTTTNPRRFRRQMEAIVNGSFHNATFSQRLWNQQDALKGELDRLLTRALIQGLNPRTVATELKKKFDSSEQAADLLMITELCRVQTEAQKLAFQEFSYEDYTFICNGGACKECEALNGKHFKVKDMQAGRNAPPMHPLCRCSTAAYMDRDAFEKWLEGQREGITWDSAIEGEEGHKGHRRDLEIARSLIESPDYGRRISSLNESKVIKKIIKQEAVSMLMHRNGTLYEDLTYIDTKTNAFATRTDYTVERKVKPNAKMTKMVLNSLRTGEKTIIAIHNHPQSTMPSLSDIQNAKRYKYGLIVGHDGSIIKYTVDADADVLIYKRI